MFVNGEKIEVSEEIYKAYWEEKNHENYLKQIDRNHKLLFFSSYDKDGHFIENLVDESVDVEKIIQTRLMIEAVRSAISNLSDEEREIVERLYFHEETLRSLAKEKQLSHPALIKKRNKILDKLKELLKDFR